MAWTILIVIVVAVAAFLVFVSRKSDTFRMERSISVNAAPEKIFPLIDDFHNWTKWSPFEKLDPDLQRSFSGAPSGKGAVYAYRGNNKVGSGSMEIKESVSFTKVLAKLDFLKPFEAHNMAEFTLVEGAGATAVTWAMYGPRPFDIKLMTTFISMDSMVGKQFEEGLANLKRVAEA